MNVFENVFVDQAPVRTVESDNPAAVNDGMDVIRCAREFADFIGDRLNGQNLVGKALPPRRWIEESGCNSVPCRAPR